MAYEELIPVQKQLQVDENKPSLPQVEETLRETDGQSGLLEIDPGHVYRLPSYDGGSPQLLVFMKREGEGYPFNVGHHPGTNNQSVYRASIWRHQYLQKQEACGENLVVIKKLRECIWQLEIRAAQRHGRQLPELPTDIENVPTCKGCGHIGCTGNHKAQTTASASALSLPDPPVSSVQHDPKSSSGELVSESSSEYNRPSVKAREAIHETAELIANCYCSEDDTFYGEVARLTSAITKIVDGSIAAGSEVSTAIQSGEADALREMLKRALREGRHGPMCDRARCVCWKAETRAALKVRALAASQSAISPGEALRTRIVEKIRLISHLWTKAAEQDSAWTSWVNAANKIANEIERMDLLAAGPTPQPDDSWHTHTCPGCDVVWDCEEIRCPEEYECPTCFAETKGVEPPKDSATPQLNIDDVQGDKEDAGE